MKLPTQCSGCGALSQAVDKEQPGFYSLTRRSVKDYLGAVPNVKTSAVDEIIKNTVENMDAELLKSLGLNEIVAPLKTPDVPICDRCHNLKHHDTGVSIYHPSVHSLRDTISESPYKYNHIYHIIDAADFPMSLIPGLHKLLDLTPQRSVNRRSKTERFYHGKKTEVSFIITRSDLLAPLKEQVDSMMPYLTSVLRDALGRAGKNVRLGNVRCVSAFQGWWTKQLKEEIWRRGGGGWMVGKVNVGKSQLFHNVFPKGTRGSAVSEEPLPLPSPAENTVREKFPIDEAEVKDEPVAIKHSSRETEAPELQQASPLLPPAQLETDYPSMPLVSALPGTTASPIRVPFGNGKGELVDLPGISRGDLELYVRPEHRSSLVMRSRIRPTQKVIKPRQSLLLGGFIRITPKDPNVIILSYAFTPIDAHLTSTEKAIGTQTQMRESSLLNIALPDVGEKIASAGTFYLRWDVTKQRTGPVTARDGAGIKVDVLPYRVLSTDILIESCGWVELVAQVRKRPSQRLDKAENSSDMPWADVSDESIDPQWPAVEVFTPGGKFIASRRPMNAWTIASKPASKAKGRPRKSMKGAKKAAKRLKRMEV
ncbi:hypothetical protein B7494_g2516 [Chlorociboria aeruginascens]|nr:hypothetical protein B7494_g2516 [Chlorociboria aeruginascens]